MAEQSPATILVVDDNPQNLALVRIQLERAGYRVVTADSGRTALDHAAVDPPDLVLLDIMMPGLDGYEVCRRFREQAYARTIPILMLTSLQDRADMLRALDAGANDFLSKPVDRAELIARVRSHLRVKELCDEIDERRHEIAAQAHQLAVEKSRAEGIIHSMADGVLTVDLEGHITLINRGVERLAGVAFDDVRGRPWASALGAHTASGQPVDDAVSPVAEVLRTGAPVSSHDVRLWRADQTMVEVSLSAAPIRQAGGDMIGVVCVLRDVTAEREAARLQQEFIALVSHEIRTPMAVIFGFAELLLSRERLSENARRFAETIYQHAQRLSDLINDFLDIHRLESGRMPIHPRAIDVQEVIQEAIHGFGPQLTRHKIVVELGRPLFVRADRDRTLQVIVNLVSNAIKYSPNGGTIRITGERAGGKVRITVTDDGLGIPPEAIPHLFEKFFRVDTPAHRTAAGTGLGLAICKQIVEAMGGQIWAASPGLGQGSSFSLTLPVAAPVVEPPLSERPVRTAMGRILLVKDDPSLVALILEQLGDAGYVVEAVASGEEAIERAHSERPAAVILDVGLAGTLDGWAVLAHFRSDPALHDIPIVMISGRDERAHGLALGVDDYLVKPVPRERLIGSLQRLAGMANVTNPVIVVDEDREASTAHAELLATHGFPAVVAAGTDEALNYLQEAAPLAVVLDLNLSGASGLQILDAIKQDPRLASVPVIGLVPQELGPDQREELSRQVAALLQKSSGAAADIVEVLRRAVDPLWPPDQTSRT